MSTERIFNVVAIPTTPDYWMSIGIVLLGMLALSCVMRSQREKRPRS